MKQHILWIAAVAMSGLPACGQDKAPTPQDNDRSQETSGVELRESETDSATERWRASWTWYNDDAPYVPARKGHAFSRQYMQYLNQVAAQERSRYGSQIPSITRTSASGDTIITTLRPTGAEPLRVSGTTWVNLGPTTAAIEKNGSFTIPGVDAGRVRSIVPHPTGKILYVAFAAAGVWKTTDGGATWTALTESLGSLSCGSLEMDPSNPSTL